MFLKHSLFGLLFFFLFATACQNELSSSPKTVKPNVLFIIADDLNCDLSTYGHPFVKSPYLDQLAATGLVFENAHCQYPLCGPSRASLMTGLYVDQTKMTQNRIYLRQTVPDVITLGQQFREAGYHAVRVGKIFHYDNPGSIGTSSFDDVYTWDYVFNPYGRDKEEEHKIEGIVPNWAGGDLSWYASEATDAELTDGIGVDYAAQQLKKFAQNGQNFFLAVGLYRPHVPFVAPQKYFKLYDKASLNVLPSDDAYLETLPKKAAQTIRAKKNQVNLPEDIARTVLQAYYASNSFVDAQVGTLLTALKQTGLDQNTIVVFTSDHGYHMGEHGHYQKRTLFDNGTRVPLILSGPGVPQNKRNNTPVELIDLFPTLMQLTQNQTPSFVQGQSLTSLFKQETQSLYKSEGALTQLYDGYSLKTPYYRITRWPEGDGFAYELYDLQKDPEEMINLAQQASQAKLLDSLKVHLEAKIAFAQQKPEGLGLQIEGVKAVRKPKMTRFLTPKNGQE
ncbi:MAG: sulfatase [Flavobacteriaceae bacterium]|jgi:arylsulfatase A-like enzyme